MEGFRLESMSELSLPDCLKDGVCLNPQGKPYASCPTRRNELEGYVPRSGILLAEDLCLNGLDNARRSRMKDPFKDLCSDIEYGIEHAIALPPGHVGEAKAALFTKVLIQIRDAQREKDIHTRSRLQYALRLQQISLFMAGFRSRIAGETLDEFTMQQIHSNICTTLATYDDDYLYGLPKDAHHEKKVVISNRTELEVEGLLSRLAVPGRFPFPAMRREEASQIKSGYNHDFYVIDKKKKIPVQVKNSSSNKKYQKVVVIRHFDILRAMKRDPYIQTQAWNPSPHHADYEWPSVFQYEQIISGEEPDPIGQLLVEEMQQGRYFDPAKRSVLNLASFYVSSRLHEYAKTHIAN